MRRRFSSWLLKVKLHPYLLVVILVILILIFAFGYLGSTFGWDWTGTNGGVNVITITKTLSGVTTTEQVVPAKTLWDWLQFFAVSGAVLVTAFAAAWTVNAQLYINRTQVEINQEQKIEEAQLTSLHTCMDQISQLVLDKRLDRSKSGDPVQKIARAKTLATLRELDGLNKGVLLNFINELGLITVNKVKIDLSNAFLMKAILSGSDLSNADLRGAILIDADLSNVNLRGANLGGAKVTSEQLAKAKSLQGATMPDGSKHP